MAIVFIDKAVSDFESLYDELSQNNEVYLLDSYQNPFWQISTIIGSKTNLSSIHVFSHGEPGILSFSHAPISSSTIGHSKKSLKSIGNS